MKIGDSIYVHGIVDEIRKDTVIIRNEGGYFGTVESEIVDTIGTVRHGHWIDDCRCSECGWCNEVESGFVGSTKGWNFCPNCGVNMRGKKE